MGRDLWNINISLYKLSCLTACLDSNKLVYHELYYQTIVIFNRITKSSVLQGISQKIFKF